MKKMRRAFKPDAFKNFEKLMKKSFYSVVTHIMGRIPKYFV